MGIRLESMETFRVEGRVTDYSVTNVGPVPGSEAFLITSEDSAVLYDSGFGFCGQALVANIRKVLGDRGLDTILLTHSHYDHILGSAHCTREWPDAEVVASGHTSDIIAKDSARRTMRELDAHAACMHGCTAHEDLTDSLRVDRVVSEGDRVRAGGSVSSCTSIPGTRSAPSGSTARRRGFSCRARHWACTSTTTPCSRRTSSGTG